MTKRAKKSVQPSDPNPKEHAQLKTRITVKYDVGFNNALYIRGQGGPLSWDKGLELKNIGWDEWVWESNVLFKECEFKVLVNDQAFETGENHHLTGGSSIIYTPHF